MSIDKARDHYNEVITNSKKQWKEIIRLSNLPTLSDSEQNTLDTLKHSFTLTLHLFPTGAALKSQDLLSTKVSHDAFGIVDHLQGISTIYIFDERIP